MPRVYDQIRNYVFNREFGNKPTVGLNSRLHRELYSDIKCLRSWDPAATSDNTHHGGIFNFDFSTDGSLLVAACERKSVLMFDPFNGKLITAKNAAHADCVNCVRFLDTRTFATCSDDTTVCLWDVRYLKQAYRTLRGHSNWVKNIEYDSRQGLLVTSGFDGSIYTWDINGYSDNGVDFKRVFHTNGLMRSKLTPDASKLVIATAGGYLMIVHNLDLLHLSDDLQGFKPNMYRLMQMSESPLRQGFMFNHLFTRERNRIEFISDFPGQNEAEMIASLEIHPQGWCVVSRNISSDENTEWTCIHDIQDIIDNTTDENTDTKTGEEVMPISDDLISQRPFFRGATMPSTSSMSGISSQLDLPPVIDLNSPPPPRLGISNPFCPPLNIESGGRNTGRSRAVGNDNPLLLTTPQDREERSGNQNLEGRNEQQVSSSLTSSASTSAASSYVVSINLNNHDRRNRPEIRVRNADGDEIINDGEREGGNSDVGAATFRTFGSQSSNTRRQRFEFRYQGANAPSASVATSSNGSSNPRSNSNLGDGSRQSRVGGDGRSQMPSSSIHRRDNEDEEDTDHSEDSTENNTASASSNNSGDNNSLQPQNVTSLRIGDSLTVIIRSGSQVAERTLLLLGKNKSDSNSDIKIHQNKKRLTHYIEEPNVGRGFIKEVCFSNDGRLICSPFSFGLRLLAFDPECNELCDTVPLQPLQLHEVTSNMSHESIVVTTKFSPVHKLLVSGCLNGKVGFHQPVL